jgi:predicted NBD/HSP70 family sugar kinase
VADEPDAAQRIGAFAKALGLTLDNLIDLLESYDLHILGGKAERLPKEHPLAVNRKVFRVGYFVTVDVDAFDEQEAGIVGERACQWPGTG